MPTAWYGLRMLFGKVTITRDPNSYDPAIGWVRDPTLKCGLPLRPEYLAAIREWVATGNTKVIHAIDDRVIINDLLDGHDHWREQAELLGAEVSRLREQVEIYKGLANVAAQVAGDPDDEE